MYIVRIWEGLGNQMFQYAFGRALKDRTGQKVFLDVKRTYRNSFELENKHVERPYLLDKFNITLKEIAVENIPAYQFLRQKTVLDKVIFDCSKRQRYFVKFIHDTDAAYHREFFSTKGDYYAFGWFQQESYFKDIRNILLREFTPKDKIRLRGGLSRLMKEESTVAVHIRRGDYLKLGNACNVIYYLKAIAYMKKKVKDPVFLIFSDDIDWAKKNIGTEDEKVYITEEYALEDYEEMLLMSRCRHQIIANSTFSWWAAWLNKNPDKIVIAPSKWFAGIQDNIVPDEWIIL